MVDIIIIDEGVFYSKSTIDRTTYWNILLKIDFYRNFIIRSFIRITFSSRYASNQVVNLFLSFRVPYYSDVVQKFFRLWSLEKFFSQYILQIYNCSCYGKTITLSNFKHPIETREMFLGGCPAVTVSEMPWT